MTGVATIELFSARVCPYAHRTRLVLAEKGLDFDLTEIDFKDKPKVGVGCQADLPESGYERSRLAKWRHSSDRIDAL